MRWLRDAANSSSNADRRILGWIWTRTSRPLGPGRLRMVWAWTQMSGGTLTTVTESGRLQFGDAPGTFCTPCPPLSDPEMVAWTTLWTFPPCRPWCSTAEIPSPVRGVLQYGGMNGQPGSQSHLCSTDPQTWHSHAFLSRNCWRILVQEPFHLPVERLFCSGGIPARWWHRPWYGALRHLQCAGIGGCVVHYAQWWKSLDSHVRLGTTCPISGLMLR